MLKKVVTLIFIVGAACYMVKVKAEIPGLIPETNWDLNGYVKYMATGSIPDHGANSLDNLIHQRFNYEYRFSSSLRFNAGMRNRALFGDSLSLPYYSEVAGLDTGYFDLSRNVIDNEHLIVNSQFDRLYLDWQGEQWNARVGRSRINWAMNTVWNPNDLFNSYSIYDFDYEERPGTDAISISRKLGFASSFDVVYSPNKDSDLQRYSARYLFNYNGWDAQTLVGRSGLDNVLGAGFAGDINGAGLRGELTWFDPWSQGEGGAQENDNATLVSSLETDFSFSGQRNWMLRASVLYISEPQEALDAEAYLTLPLTAKTLSFTRYTGYADVSFDLSALNRLTASGSYYEDGSYFVGLSNSYSLANDWQLLTVLQRFDGSTQSLFGQTPSTLLYANIKWSF
ncbi:hypothetical protein BCU70_19630 [Vibrio sp. 10N.286.49.C2]|uniref:hypothetical protein n=1 Tax=unclassified Vibrio TaxID=2614977 RepID=UPI000C850590|nr:MULTISPECIES: hypothetical protein [unclassified Vibrio]PMH34873.1 hypothetical protein BCU70_19630 [Vibrio sp. 10N.286.49.C2]PMH51339.1 hypothetical protein BCU66_16485 [Vibrio sp. 10N.286.49.B1]PMH83714.1 hypothetical protein BCU58_13855 [Vibrio sp. 10N.286.48.B7]